jgi:hypothetical protein
MKGKAKFKLVAGDPVLLCSKCSKIIKYAKYFSEEDWQAYKGEIKLSPQICDECLEKELDYE